MEVKLVAGLLTIVVGVMVLVWPFDSIAVLTLSTGIWLVIMEHRKLCGHSTPARLSEPAPQDFDASLEHLASR